jgi:hypothetical protein
MAQVQQRFLIALLLLVPGADAGRFYDDDPLWKVPKPRNVPNANERKLSEYYDFFYMTFGKPGEVAVPAQSVNTLGEVPDSNWYTNRHGRKRMSREELVRGPGNANPPATDGAWRVTGVKTEGVTAGFIIKDSKNRTYQIKFDTKLNFELSTGADVMGTKFFYALGYFTPENYLVYFSPEQLIVEPGTKFVDYRGVERVMKQKDLATILEDIPQDERGRYRAVASLYISGKPVGPFRYNGTRADDPNDTVPHEHRRELRGLRVFSAWLNHTDTKSLNSHDTLVEEDGVKYIKHYLLDFSAAFGADAFTPKSPRNGYVYMLDWKDSARSFFTFGLAVPKWTSADYPYTKGVGRIESAVFEPEKWKPHYYNPAFDNLLPDDGFWAAKQVMAFTDDDIRALVETAQYSDKEAVEYLVRTLAERRDKIGREYFSQVLPLDDFRVEGGRLEFDDLAVKHKFNAARPYTVRWFVFDNDRDVKTPLSSADSPAVPRSEARYLAAEITAAEANKAVTVYLRRAARGYDVVGVDRTWEAVPQPRPQRASTQ